MNSSEEKEKNEEWNNLVPEIHKNTSFFKKVDMPGRTLRSNKHIAMDSEERERKV